MTFHAAFERMQSEARKVHSFRTVTSVQCGQDTPKFRKMARRDLRRSSTLISLFQAGMTKRFDHFPSVLCQSTGVNAWIAPHMKG